MSARIEIIPKESAEGKLREIYENLGDDAANIIKVHSLFPESLEAHVHFYRTLMFDSSPLSRVQREMIATVVSSINECHYWMTHHGAALHRLTNDANLVIQIKQDYTIANIDSKMRAMLDYAGKLTKNPHSVTDQDVQRLKKMGCTDREILDLCQITSYFNFVNRMAEGLGVKLES